jgi:hypothetical protein
MASTQTVGRQLRRLEERARAILNGLMHPCLFFVGVTAKQNAEARCDAYWGKGYCNYIILEQHDSGMFVHCAESFLIRALEGMWYNSHNRQMSCGNMQPGGDGKMLSSSGP